MSVSIRVSGVTKKYGDKYAVKNLDFEVAPGELFALLGPSGAGKTTTLNIIAGIDFADEGEVFMNGESLAGVKPQERDFAMVFESYALYPHFTVEENMKFPLRAPAHGNGLTDDEISKIVKDCAKMLQIEELLHRYPKELSGGQKQRVGVGRALVRKPKLFLFDEPIAHLDAKLRHHMRGELKKLQKIVGVTTILATPDYNEVVAMADRAAVLSEGTIQQIGTPLELYRRPKNKIVARSIGDPPINFLNCHVTSQNGDIYLKGKGFSIKADNSIRKHLSNTNRDDLILGIRPGDMIIEMDSNNAMIAADVYVFELLGTEAVATLTINDAKLQVLCPSNAKLKIGQRIGLNFDLEKSYLFEPETGKSLID